MSSDRSGEKYNVRRADSIETDLTNDQSAGVFDINQKNETTHESVCEDLCENDSMFDKDLLKLSQKRKTSEPAHCSTKTLKAELGNKAEESSMESESDLSLSQEYQNLYSPADIRRFLQKPKASGW